mmetsp:Transcript_24738/g.52711  ORF Transcript_24738/g.52711 Transcript_24738/m.52711 type:complete len:256 (+) Transcript_24738:420-1187(+)
MFRRGIGRRPLPSRVGKTTVSKRPGAPRNRTTRFRGHRFEHSPPVSPPPPVDGSCCFFSAGSGGYSARGPSQQLASWESGARRIRNTTVESKYLEHLREVHDPAAHVKTIEDELKGAIGKALGKQGQKILMYTRLMDQERRKHEEFLERLDGEGGADAECLEKELRECATAHNEYRKECLHARWELIVHRQAVGFIVGNHKYVQDRFPVADELPVTPSNDDDDGDGSSNETQKAKEAPKKFTDQLDWWSRIGRWK